MLPDIEWTPIKEIPDPVRGPEPPPAWTPITSWSNPRVWLREAVKAFSSWLNKPTKAEKADTDAWQVAVSDWSDRICGVGAKEIDQRFRTLVRNSFPEPPASQPRSLDMPPETPSEGS